MTENKDLLATEADNTRLENNVKPDNLKEIPQEFQEFMDELEALPKEDKARAILSITRSSYREPISLRQSCWRDMRRYFLVLQIEL